MTGVRKNLIIIIFLLIGTAIILLFLNLNPSWRKQQAEILDYSPEPTNLPKKISRGTVNFFELNGSGKVIFYEEGDSIVYEADLSGKNKKELVRIPGALKIVFSSSGRELIAATSEKNVLKNYYFDLKNNKKTELPKGAENAVFSPESQKIAFYLYNDEIGEGEILLAGLDGASPKTIFKTRIKDLTLIWPENDLIVFHLKKEGDQFLAFSIKPDGKEFRKLTEKEFSLYNTAPKIEEANILKESGIETIVLKTSPLKDYLIFLNARDGRLYSLGL